MAQAIKDKEFYDLCLAKLNYNKSTGAFSWADTGSLCESMDANGYLRVKVSGKYVKLHRLAWYAVNGEIPDLLDHINRDKADNRIENLRLATHKENCRNRKSVGATSFYKGVCYRKTDNKFVARILVDGKREFLGAYKTEINAAVAYDMRAKEVYKDFAVLNFEEIV